MSSIIRQRRDSTVNWTSENPVIPAGQLCFDTDLNLYRMGNGVDNYLDLTPGGLTGVLSTDLDFNGFTANKTAVRQIADASPADASTHPFDYSLGDMQKVTCPAVGTLTMSFANLPIGDVAAFIIDLVNGGDCTVSWPVGTQFDTGIAPTLTVAGTDRLLVIKDSSEVYTVIVSALDIK